MIYITHERSKITPKKKNLNEPKQQNLLGKKLTQKNWVQPLLFGGLLQDKLVFNLPFPLNVIVIEGTLSVLPLTVRHKCDLRDTETMDLRVTRCFPIPFLGKQRIFFWVASILPMHICPHKQPTCNLLKLLYIQVKKYKIFYLQ